MSTLKLTYFGTFQVEVNGQLITNFRTEKTAALLAYMALEGHQSQPRAYFTNLLWHGYEANAAQTSLRVALTYLRQMLAPLEPVKATRKHLHWDSTSLTVWNDAQALTRIVYDKPEQITAQQLTELLKVYRGEFLEGWETLDSAPFQVWLQQRRAEYQTLVDRLQRRLTMLTIPGNLPLRHNLPRRLTPLFGHMPLLEQVRAFLCDPDQPLITLVGEGGVGKSRLALAVTWSLLAEAETSINAAYFTHGMWFVPLSDLSPSPNLLDQLATAIGVACGISFAATTPPTEQLSAWLRTKSLLLILDSFEHLIAASSWLEGILQIAPGVKFLVTTRQRLPLQAAIVIPVRELATPTPDLNTSVEELTTYPSIQLFVERGQRVRPGFRLQPGNAAAVAQICRQMAGLPLGIELAASLLLLYGPEQIAAQLAQEAMTLQAQWVDLPARQRTMEEVLTTSWRLLTAEEAGLLARLAVIKGRFTLTAATTIGDTQPATLFALISKSLLRQVVDAERVTLHDLVRDYALRQLQQQPAVEVATRRRHATYYLGLVQEQAAALPNTRAAQELILAELDNVRAAWQWSIEEGEIELLEQALNGLAWFYRLAGLRAEANAVFGAAAALLRQQLATSDPTNRRHQALLARLLVSDSDLTNFWFTGKERRQQLEEALLWSERSGDVESRALIYNELALLARAPFDLPTIAAMAQQAVSWAQQSPDHHLQVICMHTLATVHSLRAEWDAGFALLATIQQLLAQRPNGYLRFELLNYFGAFCMAQQWYQQAINTLQSAFLQATRIRQRYSMIRIFLGQLWIALGSYQAAEFTLSLALTDFRQQEHLNFIALTERELGYLHLCQGHATAAYHHLATALQLSQAHGLHWVEQLTVIDVGHTLSALGRLPEAAAAYQRVIAIYEGYQLAAHVGEAYAGLAHLALAQGDLAQARTMVEQALVRLRAGQSLYHERFQTYWHCYEVLHALGDPRASAFLQETYADLLRVAAALTDPLLKQAFLENVAVNRTIIAAAQAQPQ